MSRRQRNYLWALVFWCWYSTRYGSQVPRVVSTAFPGDVLFPPDDRKRLFSSAHIFWTACLLVCREYDCWWFVLQLTHGWWRWWWGGVTYSQNFRGLLVRASAPSTPNTLDSVSLRVRYRWSKRCASPTPVGSHSLCTDQLSLRNTRARSPRKWWKYMKISGKSPKS